MSQDSCRVHDDIDLFLWTGAEPLTLAAPPTKPRFDGDVMIVLNGIYGATEEKELINSSDPAYLPGSTENFSLNLKDVGALSTVRVLEDVLMKEMGGIELKIFHFCPYPLLVLPRGISF